jgi:hypothetical protein
MRLTLALVFVGVLAMFMASYTQNIGFGRAYEKTVPVGDDHWERFCYPEFAEQVERVVGKNAVDCGFYDHPEPHAQRKAQSCMQAAIEGGRVFKAGYLSSGDDSSYCHAVLGMADKRFVAIFYDFDVTGANDSDGKSADRLVQLCDTIAYEPGLIGKGSFFKPESCAPAWDAVDRMNTVGRSKWP